MAKRFTELTTAILSEYVKLTAGLFVMKWKEARFLPTVSVSYFLNPLILLSGAPQVRVELFYGGI